MTRVRFRKEAEHDLRTIIACYEGVAPEVLPYVTADIWRAIDLVRQYPAIGRMVRGRDVRRVVTRRYRFKVAYRTHAEEIVVLGIFRFQNRET